jgi:NCS1 family nucleobase:cation symporter-1
MSPATREAKANPDSNLSKWFSTALDSFKSFACFMDEISEEDLTGFWGRRKYFDIYPMNES